MGDDLKNLSVYELAMRLNNIIKAKSNGRLTQYDIVCLDTEWNRVVMELWDRIPSLKDDVNVQPILTEIYPERKAGRNK